MKLINADTIPYFGETEVGDHITFKSAIDKLEEVDAVEVVRCKDCRSYEYFDDGEHGYRGYCLRTISVENRKEQDFCSYGKRKDGGNE